MKPASAIAIVGMSGRFPGANGVDELWNNIAAARETIHSFSESELEARDQAARRGGPAYVRARGLLEGVDLWDAPFFGMTPREAELIDPQHRIFLECCWEALEDAGYDPERYPGAIGVIAGQSLPTYLLSSLARDGAFLDQVTGEYQVGSYPVVLGNDKDYLATRVCYRFNLRGAGMTVQSACSTSLVAVCQAVQSLLTYQMDMALAGGVSVTFPQKRGYLFQEGGMVSPDGHCRPFDESAGGTVFSNGAGVVLLKRLEDAIEEGDHVYAVIRGAALNNDGSLKVGFMAPSPDRQAEVIAMAHALAGVDARSIGYVETHGTGTPLGDPIEFEGLSRAFSLGTAGEGYCALGSLKGNVGHLEVAAGVSGLIKTALALSKRQLPPSINFEKPNRKIRFEGSPFYVNTALKVWPAGAEPRRAGVSAFGVGGTNAHVVVEEAPPRSASAKAWPQQLLTLSARSPAALDAQCARLAAYLAANPDVPLADVAYTLQVGRQAFAHRRAFACGDTATAVSRLREPAQLVSGVHERGAPETAFLFPGQGAQHVGMAAQLYLADAQFRADVDRSCEVLKMELGFDLRTLLFDTSADAAGQARLAQTVVTQPALFVVEYALARLWQRLGVQPRAMVGHSVGEYVAACLAGIFELEDALRLVAARGALVQSLPGGSMLSVRLAEAEVRLRMGEGLDIAAVNAPALCVVSGPSARIDALEAQLTAGQVACRKLRTSHAFHSSMMEPILGQFGERVARVKLRAPSLPIFSSTTGAPLTAAQATDPGYWTRHVREPVRFAAAVAALPAGAVLIECGPGRVLSQLARQSAPAPGPAAVISSLPDASEAGASDLAALLDGVGRAFCAGVAIDFAALHENGARRRVRLPTYPFERKRYFIDPPSREAAPPAGAAATPEGVEELLRTQMEIMSRQLELLKAEDES